MLKLHQKKIIKNKEVGLKQYTNLLTQEKASLEEKNARLTKAEAKLKKQLEDSKNNESNLVQKYNKLKQEKGKVNKNATTLEKDLSNKIPSLGNTKTKSEKNNASVNEEQSLNITQGDQEEEDKAETKEGNQKEKRYSPLSNIDGLRNRIQCGR